MASGGAIQEDIKEEDEEEEDDDDDKNDDVFGPEKQALTNVSDSPTGLIKQTSPGKLKAGWCRRGGRDLGQQDHLHVGHHRIRRGPRQRLEVNKEI